MIRTDPIQKTAWLGPLVAICVFAWSPALQAQVPAGGARAGADDVWVRVVRNSTGGRTVTSHNGNTHIQEVITYDHLNRQVLKRTYMLNRYGAPEEFMVYDGRGVVVYRGEFIYDAQDRLTEEKLYAMPGSHLVRRLVYDPFDPKRKPQSQSFGVGVSSEILEQMNLENDNVEVRPGDQPAAQPEKKPGLFKKLFGGGKK